MALRLKTLTFLGLMLGWGTLAHSLSPALAAGGTELLFAAPWHGSYMCNQGLTRLQLTLRPIAGRGAERVEADFVFSADPDNPSVPKGSFRMSGSFNRETGALALKQERWLEQPSDPSYRMVDLTGRFRQEENRALIQGQITNYGCQDFAVWQFFATGETETRP